MTIKIAAFWELGWNTPIKEADLWMYPLRDFEVDQHYMVPVSGIYNTRISERDSIEKVLEENQDLTVVFCDENGDQKLTDFKHPENTLYIFGKTNYSPFLSLKREQDFSLRVETIKNRGLLWGHQAASIILYDRMVKQWQ
jgi:tRNA(Leu) C34 or U34 (ribose-2'-O)-methylase TrmL